MDIKLPPGGVLLPDAPTPIVAARLPDHAGTLAFMGGPAILDESTPLGALLSLLDRAPKGLYGVIPQLLSPVIYGMIGQATSAGHKDVLESAPGCSALMGSLLSPSSLGLTGRYAREVVEVARLIDDAVKTSHPGARGLSYTYLVSSLPFVGVSPSKPLIMEVSNSTPGVGSNPMSVRYTIPSDFDSGDADVEMAQRAWALLTYIVNTDAPANRLATEITSASGQRLGTAMGRLRERVWRVTAALRDSIEVNGLPANFDGTGTVPDGWPMLVQDPANPIEPTFTKDGRDALGGGSITSLGKAGYGPVAIKRYLSMLMARCFSERGNLTEIVAASMEFVCYIMGAAGLFRWDMPLVRIPYVEVRATALTYENMLDVGARVVYSTALAPLAAVTPADKERHAQQKALATVLARVARGLQSAMVSYAAVARDIGQEKAVLEEVYRKGLPRTGVTAMLFRGITLPWNLYNTFHQQNQGITPSTFAGADVDRGPDGLLSLIKMCEQHSRVSMISDEDLGGQVGFHDFGAVTVIGYELPAISDRMAAGFALAVTNPLCGSLQLTGIDMPDFNVVAYLHDMMKGLNTELQRSRAHEVLSFSPTVRIVRPTNSGLMTIFGCRYLRLCAGRGWQYIIPVDAAMAREFGVTEDTNVLVQTLAKLYNVIDTRSFPHPIGHGRGLVEVLDDLAKKGDVSVDVRSGSVVRGKPTTAFLAPVEAETFRVMWPVIPQVLQRDEKTGRWNPSHFTVTRDHIMALVGVNDNLMMSAVPTVAPPYCKYETTSSPPAEYVDAFTSFGLDAEVWIQRTYDTNMPLDRYIQHTRTADISISLLEVTTLPSVPVRVRHELWGQVDALVSLVLRATAALRNDNLHGVNGVTFRASVGNTYQTEAWRAYRQVLYATLGGGFEMDVAANLANFIRRLCAQLGTLRTYMKVTAASVAEPYAPEHKANAPLAFLSVAPDYLESSWAIFALLDVNIEMLRFLGATSMVKLIRCAFHPAVWLHLTSSPEARTATLAALRNGASNGVPRV